MSVATTYIIVNILLNNVLFLDNLVGSVLVGMYSADKMLSK